MDKRNSNLISAKRIRNQLQVFNACTGLKTEILDAELAFPEEQTENICPLRASNLVRDEVCEEFTKNACSYAVGQSESHVFMCPVSLTRIACRICRKNTVMGVLLTSPFLMDGPDPTMLQKQDDFVDGTATTLVDIYDMMIHLPVIEAQKVHYYAQFLECIADSLIREERPEERLAQEQLTQQASINRTIQQYKGDNIHISDEYPLMKEKNMLEQFSSGNIAGAEQLLDELLAYCYMFWTLNLEGIRDRIIEIGAMLSRSAMENGVSSALIYDLNSQFYKDLFKTESYAEICNAARNQLRALGNMLVQLRKLPGSDVVRRAIGMIYEHFAEPITLASVADLLEVSRFHLSRSFSICAGMSFRDFVNHVRIEQSKLLLRGTNMTLVEIAVSVGFSDQSYFSKVFKKNVGITPKQYR